MKMKIYEQAWVVQEYLSKTQTEIASELETTPSFICHTIKLFCDSWSGVKVTDLQIYDEHRKEICIRALENYDSSIGINPQKPVAGRHPHYFLMGEARDEYAWMLRAEGMTYRQIGDRLGVSIERARQLVYKFGRRASKAMRRVKFCFRDDPLSV